MSNDVKQRRKAPPKSNEEGKAEVSGKAEVPGKAAKTKTENCTTAEPTKRTDSRGGSCPDPRTVLCLVSLAVCLASTWFVFQQSLAFADVQKQYRLSETKASQLNALEDKVTLLSEKCEHSQNIMDQLKNHQIIENLEYLQQDIANIRKWSETLTNKREQLQQNMTTLFQTVTKTEQSMASVANDLSGRITIVKTDLRRISGIGSDANTLADSVHELEDKLEKVVKKTEQNIGHLLASNIDRITELKGSARRNSERLDMIKGSFSELMADFRKQSDMFLNLQSDRVKVLKTLTFVNDLKPKVFSMRNDFALLNPVVHDLTLRIGRLASDLLHREGEIALLSEKVSYLTQVTTEVNEMKVNIANLSESGE